MNPQTWWFLARASGIVAWALLAISCLWGILLITRMLKPADRPAWLLDLHRWLSALAVIATAVHLGALVADSYVHFGWTEILIPQASAWKAWPVTLGIVSMYAMGIVHLSSLLMRRLPRALWRALHLLAYVSFGFATAHGALAGTDRGNNVYIFVVGGLTTVVILATLARVLQQRAKRVQRSAASTSDQEAFQRAMAGPSR